MDAKLERLSLSVSDKLQEAEQLDKQGDELEQKIARQCGCSPTTKLSQQKLLEASLQVELAEMLVKQSTVMNAINVADDHIKAGQMKIEDIQKSYLSIVQIMEISASIVARHMQQMSDFLSPMLEMDIMQQNELESLRSECGVLQLSGNYSNGHSSLRLADLERKVAMTKLEISQAESMLEAVEREHSSLASSTTN